MARSSPRMNRRPPPTHTHPLCTPLPLTVLPFSSRARVSAVAAQLRRFDVAGIHRSSITALAWSPNGMKLFSGDGRGKVVYSSLDLDQVKSSQSLVDAPLGGI